MSDVTQILSAIEQGDPHAAGDLLPLVYDELRRLAARKLAQERPAQTLEATALVHEAYPRRVDVEQARPFHGRGHFFAAAAEAMRRTQGWITEYGKETLEPSPNPVGVLAVRKGRFALPNTH
jgi:hypothetical protein